MTKETLKKKLNEVNGKINYIKEDHVIDNEDYLKYKLKLLNNLLKRKSSYEEKLKLKRSK